VSTPAAATSIGLLIPEWPAPPRVRAAFTLRTGGASAPPFDSLNVGVHVGDDASAVMENRGRVRRYLHLPADPRWIEQVHGTDVLDLDGTLPSGTPGLRSADAVVTRRTGQVCVVQVADCLPVLFATRDASAIAAAHAGWRGLAAGVLEATLAALAVEPANVMAWLGPAIGPAHFEVGDEVRMAFLTRDPDAATAFTRNLRDRWQCDLAVLARRRLAALGVRAVFGGNWCTYGDRARFFSYRRDGHCGRMAALIWLEG
jgi:polyphenol oxidase